MRGILIGLWFGYLVFVETRRALRRSVEPKLQRDMRNLVIASAAGLVMTLAEKPLAEGTARWVSKRRFGLVHWLKLPPVAALLLMDYTLYLWHVLTHKVPFLWRTHRVHHMDLDLDASTALRFHFAEMLLSVPFRAAQIALIGTSPRTLQAWQTCLLVSILFHHSNWRLPKHVESAFAKVIVTPRLHGIHHSIEDSEVNSNWSSGLTIWDRLHGTYREDVPQETIVIGVRGFLESEQVTAARMLSLPFQPE